LIDLKTKKQGRTLNIKNSINFFQVESARAQNQPVKVGPFLRRNIEARLRMNIPFIAKWPEALALRAHPQVRLCPFNYQFTNFREKGIATKIFISYH
jgi:hypothetical protein